MKPFVVLILALLVAVGAVIFFQNLEQPSDQGLITDPDIRDGDKKDDPDGGKGSATLAGTETEKPTLEPEAAQLRTSAAVLFIGFNDVTWTASLRQAFNAMKEISYASWFFETTSGGTDRAGASAGPARGLEKPTSQPDAEWLETNDIRALFLDAADPNAFPKSFWETVARRVNSGRMGLYIRPSTPGGEPVWSVHPVLTHPILKGLVPVAKARKVAGSPPPGLFTEAAQSLTITSDGLRHPAMRLVADVEDSANAWAFTRTGDGAYESRFVYPVESAAPDAKVLMETDNGDYPAVIVSGGNARVLWQGTVDFGGRAEFVREKKLYQTMIMTHWILWLVGQADE